MEKSWKSAFSQNMTCSMGSTYRDESYFDGLKKIRSPQFSIAIWTSIRKSFRSNFASGCQPVGPSLSSQNPGRLLFALTITIFSLSFPSVPCFAQTGDERLETERRLQALQEQL